MKYTDRRNSKMKWNTFLKIVIPVFTIYQIVNFYVMIADVFQLPLVFGSIGPISSWMQAKGASLENMGVYFIPVVTILMNGLISTICSIYAWIGLWRWKISGPIAIVISNVVLVLSASILLYYAMHGIYYSTIPTEATHAIMVVNIVVYASTILMSVLLAIFEGIYYYKRRLLFSSYYQQPSDLPLHKEQMVCPNCGYMIKDSTSQYCPNCGQKLH